MDAVQQSLDSTGDSLDRDCLPLSPLRILWSKIRCWVWRWCLLQLFLAHVRWPAVGWRSLHVNSTWGVWLLLQLWTWRVLSSVPNWCCAWLCLFSSFLVGLPSAILWRLMGINHTWGVWFFRILLQFWARRVLSSVPNWCCAWLCLCSSFLVGLRSAILWRLMCINHTWGVWLFRILLQFWARRVLSSVPNWCCAWLCLFSSFLVGLPSAILWRLMCINHTWGVWLFRSLLQFRARRVLSSVPNWCCAWLCLFSSFLVGLPSAILWHCLHVSNTWCFWLSWLLLQLWNSSVLFRRYKWCCARLCLLSPLAFLSSLRWHRLLLCLPRGSLTWPSLRIIQDHWDALDLAWLWDRLFHFGLRKIQHPWLRISESVWLHILWGRWCRRCRRCCQGLGGQHRHQRSTGSCWNSWNVTELLHTGLAKMMPNDAKRSSEPWIKDQSDQKLHFGNEMPVHFSEFFIIIGLMSQNLTAENPWKSYGRCFSCTREPPGNAAESGTGSAGSAPADDRRDTRDLTVPNVHGDDASASRCLRCLHCPAKSPRVNTWSDKIWKINFQDLKVDHDPWCWYICANIFGVYWWDPCYHI